MPCVRLVILGWVSGGPDGRRGIRQNATLRSRSRTLCPCGDENAARARLPRSVDGRQGGIRAQVGREGRRSSPTVPQYGVLADKLLRPGGHVPPTWSRRGADRNEPVSPGGDPHAGRVARPASRCSGRTDAAVRSSGSDPSGPGSMPDAALIAGPGRPDGVRRRCRSPDRVDAVRRSRRRDGRRAAASHRAEESRRVAGHPVAGH